MSTTTTPTGRRFICEWCGSSSQVAVVDVTDRRTGKPVVLHLCEACRESRTRTWRLRYQLESSQ